MNSKSLDLLLQAYRIRLVEEKIIELYPSDCIQSPVHLSIGQESVAVGICDNLKLEDWIFINYRGHAFYLAKGGPLDKFFAELMGKKTGISKGKAGSMHLSYPSQGIMGASAVVASTISHAVGAALAEKIKKQSNRIFISIFGDGALEQGVIHESLNFAKLHKVPILFLCEDNELAVHSPTYERQAFSIKDFISSYSIKFKSIEQGYDPSIVSLESKEIIDYVRHERAPAFLRIKTARYKEHVGPGEDFHAGYRSEEIINQWKNKDPIILHKETLSSFKKKINLEIESAVNFAYNSPLPTKEDLLTDVI